MKKRASVFLFLLIGIGCFAQTAGYKYYSDFNRIEKSGFYNIELPPEITSHLKTDLADIRVTDSSGRWVPHHVQIPCYTVIREAIFFDMKYSLVENSRINTTAIIQNNIDTLSNIIVRISNSPVQRFFDLSGSNDQKNWSVINDSILPDPAEPFTKTISQIRLNFPPINYTFIKLHIRNDNRDPFGIVGIYTQSVIHDNSKSSLDYKIIQNPVSIVKQTDRGKVSYIQIIQQESNIFSDFNISIKGSKYFSRKMDLYLPDSGTSDLLRAHLIQSFTLSNNSTLRFRCALVKATVFYLLIHNADNPPLVIDSVTTGYNYMYLTTYLEKGNSYKLFFDNPYAVKPDYDLDSLNIGGLHDSMPFLSRGNINVVDEEKGAALTEKKNNKLLLWSVIILILCLLLFFTYKMLKETKQKEDVHI